jgi:hypothetical protein
MRLDGEDYIVHRRKAKKKNHFRRVPAFSSKAGNPTIAAASKDIGTTPVQLPAYPGGCVESMAR